MSYGIPFMWHFPKEANLQRLEMGMATNGHWEVGWRGRSIHTAPVWDAAWQRSKAVWERCLSVAAASGSGELGPTWGIGPIRTCTEDSEAGFLTVRGRSYRGGREKARRNPVLLGQNWARWCELVVFGIDK